MDRFRKYNKGKFSIFTPDCFVAESFKMNKKGLQHMRRRKWISV